MRYFVWPIIAILAPVLSFAASKPPLESLSIPALQTAFANHEITCVQLIEQYLNRIANYNLNAETQAPYNAFTALNPHILEEAAEKDRLLEKTAGPANPLHCVPVVLKDNIDSVDSPSTSGSLSMLGNQASSDAAVVTSLKKAGALILGKGTMDEFSTGVSGVSTRSGRTGNAYATDENPGGSSSGTAVAVSAEFALAGIGTDNSGSARIPAAFNGLVALRPSKGAFSTQGVFPIGLADVSVSPMARSSTDLAILFHAMKNESFNIKQLNSAQVKKRRIGILKQAGAISTFSNMPQEGQYLMEEAYANFESLGITLVPDLELPQFIEERHLNAAEEREEIDAYLASSASTRKSYEDICRSGRTLVFGSVRHCLEWNEPVSAKHSAAHAKNEKIFAKNQAMIQALMKKHHLDGLVIPVSSAGFASYRNDYVRNELIASNANLPAITFPVGYHSKTQLPLGIEIIGLPNSEDLLLQFAHAYEAKTSVRKSPTMPQISAIHTGPIDIAELNAQFNRVGYKAFEQVLMKNHHLAPNAALTPDAFKKIVKAMP